MVAGFVDGAWDAGFLETLTERTASAAGADDDDFGLLSVLGLTITVVCLLTPAIFMV